MVNSFVKILNKFIKQMGIAFYVVIFILLVAALSGYFRAAHIHENGIWKVSCDSDSSFYWLQKGEVLGKIFDFWPDTVIYRRLVYGTSTQGTGHAWYDKKSQELIGYVEVLDAWGDSMLLIDLNFQKHGRADLFLKFIKEEDLQMINWSYHASFGDNPVARLFGPELRKLLGQHMKIYGQNLDSLICYNSSKEN